MAPARCGPGVWRPLPAAWISCRILGTARTCVAPSLSPRLRRACHTSVAVPCSGGLPGPRTGLPTRRRSGTRDSFADTHGSLAYWEGGASRYTPTACCVRRGVPSAREGFIATPALAAVAPSGGGRPGTQPAAARGTIRRRGTAAHTPGSGGTAAPCRSAGGSSASVGEHARGGASRKGPQGLNSTDEWLPTIRGTR